MQKFILKRKDCQCLKFRFQGRILWPLSHLWYNLRMFLDLLELNIENKLWAFAPRNRQRFLTLWCFFFICSIFTFGTLFLLLALRLPTTLAKYIFGNTIIIPFSFFLLFFFQYGPICSQKKIKRQIFSTF